MMIFDTTKRDTWNVNRTGRLPPVATPVIDVVPPSPMPCVSDRLCGAQEIDNARSGSNANSQKLPDVRLNASYQASGVGARRFCAPGRSERLSARGLVTDFGSVLNQLFARNYPT
jgi:hypothetical protein